MNQSRLTQRLSNSSKNIPSAATIPADKNEPLVRLYQRQTWCELAEHSRPLTSKLTRWCMSFMG
jgi:hypothetical protein